ASDEGTLEVTCAALGTGGSFAVAAKSGGALVDKAVGAIGDAATLEVPYSDGQEIFFTASPVDDGLPAPIASCWYYVDEDHDGEDDANEKRYLPVKGYATVHSAPPHLLRAYRGWSYAAYRPRSDEFTPIEGAILFGQGDFDDDDEPADPA